MMNMKDLKKMDRDDLLALVGLERKSSADWIVPTLSALGVGLLVGAGLGLLLAPKAGRELREDLTQKLQGTADSLASASNGMRNEFGNLEKRTI